MSLNVNEMFNNKVYVVTGGDAGAFQPLQPLSL